MLEDNGPVMWQGDIRDQILCSYSISYKDSQKGTGVKPKLNFQRKVKQHVVPLQGNTIHYLVGENKWGIVNCSFACSFETYHITCDTETAIAQGPQKVAIFHKLMMPSQHHQQDIEIKMKLSVKKKGSISKLPFSNTSHNLQMSTQ